MASSTPTNVSFTQAQDLQRQLEGILLKMEKAGLVHEKAGDHIRVIAAEGIAEHFGDRYRAYPSVPRPDKVPIRRDLVPTPCVLASSANKEKTHVKKKAIEFSAAETNLASPTKTVVTTTTTTTTTTNSNHGATRRVSAWAAGVANASSASISSDRSITSETLLAANASRWDAVLDNSIKLSSTASRGSYILSEGKTEKMNASAANLTASGKPTVAKDTAGDIETEAGVTCLLDTTNNAISIPVADTITAKVTDTENSNECDDYSDWLIDLSS